MRSLSSPLLVALATLALPAWSCRRAERPPPSADTLARLAVLPRDASMVFGLDLARARAASLGRRYLDLARAELPSQADQIKTTCGIDPLDQIDAAVVSIGSDLEDPETAFAIIKGKVDEPKVGKCLVDLAARRGSELTIARASAITTYTAKDTDEVIHARWIAPDTVAVAPAALDDAAPLAHLAAAGGGLDRNAEIAALLAQIDTRAILWGAGALPPFARRQLRSMGYVPDGFFFAVDLATDVEGVLGLRYEDERSAVSSARLLRTALEQLRESPPLPLLKDILGRASISQSGRMVRMTCTLTADQLEAVRAAAAELAATLPAAPRPAAAEPAAVPAAD